MKRILFISLISLIFCSCSGGDSSNSGGGNYSNNIPQSSNTDDAPNNSESSINMSEESDEEFARKLGVSESQMGVINYTNKTVQDAENGVMLDQNQMMRQNGLNSSQGIRNSVQQSENSIRDGRAYDKYSSEAIPALEQGRATENQVGN